MEKVGERLAQAQDSYEVAFNQFSKGRGNVLSQVENLKTLGAKTSKSINTDFENTEEIEKSETDLDIR
jgi:DNA recombination protein RmuC